MAKRKSSPKRSRKPRRGHLVRRQSPTSAASTPVLLDRVERRILLIRGQKVLLSRDLAALYGVATRALNQAVRRNADRFPRDFMFQLTADEAASLRSQSVTLDESAPDDAALVARGGRGRHSKYLPLAFTEQGVAMLSSVLRGPRAAAVNIAIMRVFVRLRRLLATHADLARRIDELDRKFGNRTHDHDRHIQRIYELIEQLMGPPPSAKKGRIGFRGRDDD